MQTKKYFFLILLILLYTTFSIAATITPNGKQINLDWSGNDLSTSSINAINWIVENYWNVEVIQSSQKKHGRYNCHFYAWHNNQGYGIWTQNYIWKNGQPSQLGWDYYPTDYYMDGAYSVPSGYPSYVSTSSSSAEICVYKSGGSITHSARMLQNSNKVISKWGSWGIYKHDPYECPDGRMYYDPQDQQWKYSADYGTITNYYKINPKYRPVGSGDPGGRNWGTIQNALSGIPSGGCVAVRSGPHAISSDITVPANVKLAFLNNSTISPNGHEILPGSGQITVGNGVISHATIEKNNRV